MHCSTFHERMIITRLRCGTSKGGWSKHCLLRQRRADENEGIVIVVIVFGVWALHFSYAVYYDKFAFTVNRVDIDDFPRIGNSNNSRSSSRLRYRQRDGMPLLHVSLLHCGFPCVQTHTHAHIKYRVPGFS